MTVLQILHIAQAATELAEQVLELLQFIESDDRAIELVGIERRLVEARAALKRAIEQRERRVGKENEGC